MDIKAIFWFNTGDEWKIVIWWLLIVIGVKEAITSYFWSGCI